MPSTSARSCCNEKAVCLDIVQHNKCNNRLRYASTWSLRNATYSKFCPVSCRGTCPACTASERSTSGLAKLYKVVDVVMFNDELSVLRYRFRLHSAFADTFVVAETAITYAGHAKPLHASNSLTEAEKRAYDVRIFVVPVLRSIASPTRSENWRRENHQRSSLNRYLADNFKKHLIFFSDLDEFLDPEAMRTTLLSSAHLADSAVGCITPRMRFYYYSEHCPVFEPWAAATLSRSDSYFFTKVVQAGMLLRWWGQGHSGGVGQNALAKHKFERHSGRAVCPEPDGLHGWHFSYAMSTADILSKMRASVAADDKDFGQGSRLNRMRLEARAKLVERRVRTCADPYARRGVNISFADVAYDGRLPPIPGWPRHPLAPTRPEDVATALSSEA